MANSISAVKHQKYAKKTQALLEEKLIAMELANMTLTADMPNGNTLNYQRPTYLNVSDYTKYNNATDQDITYTNEQLVINKTPIISFVMDYSEDKPESAYDIAAQDAEKSAFRIRQDIEGNFFNEYSNADIVPFASSVVLSTSNVVSTYGQAFAELSNEGVDDSNIALVVDPYQFNMIGQGAIGNTFNVSDESYKRGYKGEFQGMQLYVARNLTATVDLAVATNPTANDTVTINGVVFTFVASPAAAGDVDIAGSAAASVDNLVLAINGEGTPGSSTYIEVSAKDRAKLSGLTAVDNTTSIALTSKRGYRVVSSDLDDASDKFGVVTIHNIAMEKGAIHMVLRSTVNTEEQQVPGQLTKRYLTWSRYGIKTFSEGAERMADIAIAAQAAEA